MLGIYTDDELRAELKRRAKLRRANAVRKPTEYIYLKGIVYHIDNINYQGKNWKGEEYIKYKPYAQWQFMLADMECDEPKVTNWAFHTRFKCSLPKSKAPKVGDKVIIKIRKVKQLMPSNVRGSKIVEVIK
jgi:hypothetical protein